MANFLTVAHMPTSTILISLNKYCSDKKLTYWTSFRETCKFIHGQTYPEALMKRRCVVYKIADIPFFTRLRRSQKEG